MSPDETDEEDEQQYGAHYDRQGSKRLNAVSDQEIQSCAYGETGQGGHRRPWCMHQERKRAPRKKHENPRQLWRGAKSCVSKLQIENGTEYRHREKNVEEWNSSQAFEEFLRAGVNENDDQQYSGYRQH
jgi:hypothetical protein